ncbi:hypothetical protein HZ994_17120 [Akkermansiaceae bacterium]|nr:hypothetical protein HZ994_17120 [Akkermansiaceae bacterium]
MHLSAKRSALAAAICLLPCLSIAEEVGERWGTAEREREYYRLTNLPIPENLVIEAGAFAALPDGRTAIGTRHGDVFFVSGIDAPNPRPEYMLFATGLDEIFGLAWKDGSLFVTHSAELTKVTDTDGDGKADRYDTVSDAWGYGTYHEYAFGSKFDPAGNLYVALGLSSSYHSQELFRGWALKISPDGKTTPIASGLRSPGGIGFNEHGALFYIESQGPWNSACSLKFLKQGGFMGHPISFNWYDFAPNMGPAPVQPESGSRIVTEKERVKELVPYAVIFPYIRMGRSISGFEINRTKGKFGPFEDQIFLGDYTLSLVMRATTEQVNGVWQGACYPFREELSTGLLNVHFTPEGNLVCGGTNRGWPVRGLKPYALERLEWTGKMPFEIKEIKITPDGFCLNFTKPVDPKTGSLHQSYRMATFTHRYHAGYGGPEIEQTVPEVTAVELSEDGLSATLRVDGVTKGHVHEFHLDPLRDLDGEPLLHNFAFYTVNEIPQ